MGENRRDLLVRHAMAGDDEKTDMLAGVPHRGDDRAPRGRIAIYERRDIDDRHHSGGISHAFATRHEISVGS